MASSQVSVFGSISSVLGVKDMDKKPEMGIPDMYIRTEQEPPIRSDETTPLPTIPIFDFKSLVCENTRDTTELEKLYTACKDWGFFQVSPNIYIYIFRYPTCPDEKKICNMMLIPSELTNVFMQVVNHGVNPQLLEKLKLEIEKFFQLPIEEKKKYQIRPGDVQGYGTVIRCKDQKLDWGDRFYMLINPVERRKPYLFPELPSSLRSFFSLSLLYHSYSMLG